MRDLLRVMAILIGVAVIFVAIAFAALWFLTDSSCGVREVQTLPSPDKRHIAFLFERDCGATTDFSTQAAVYSYGTKLPNKIGNTFAADANHEVGVRGPWGGPTATIRWLDNKTLELRYHQTARIFKQKYQIDDVSIRYVSSVTKVGFPLSRE